MVVAFVMHLGSLITQQQKAKKKKKKNLPVGDIQRDLTIEFVQY